MKYVETTDGIGVSLVNDEDAAFIAGDGLIKVKITCEQERTVTYKRTYEITANSISDAIQQIDNDCNDGLDFDEDETNCDDSDGLSNYKVINLEVLQEDGLPVEDLLPMLGQLTLFGGVVE